MCFLTPFTPALECRQTSNWQLKLNEGCFSVIFCVNALKTSHWDFITQLGFCCYRAKTAQLSIFDAQEEIWSLNLMFLIYEASFFCLVFHFNGFGKRRRSKETWPHHSYQLLCSCGAHFLFYCPSVLGFLAKPAHTSVLRSYLDVRVTILLSSTLKM